MACVLKRDDGQDIIFICYLLFGLYLRKPAYHTTDNTNAFQKC